MRILILMLISMGALAESSSLNLNLPATPGSYASDRIRADNVECSMAIGASTNLEFGVVGVLNQNGPYTSNFSMPDDYDSNELIKDVGVYAKITVPLNPPKSRLDCNKLYQLELEIKRMEVQKLKQEIANLRALKFEGED
jgi:hypothetical protein